MASHSDIPDHNHTLNQLDLINAIERLLLLTNQSFILLTRHTPNQIDTPAGTQPRDHVWCRGSADLQYQAIALRNLAERSEVPFEFLSQLEPGLRELDAATETPTSTPEAHRTHSNNALLYLLDEVVLIAKTGAPSVLIHGSSLLPDDPSNPDQLFLDRLTLLKQMVANFLNEVTPRIQSGEMHPDGDFRVEVKRITPNTTGTLQ